MNKKNKKNLKSKNSIFNKDLKPWSEEELEQLRKERRHYQKRGQQADGLFSKTFCDKTNPSEKTEGNK